LNPYLLFPGISSSYINANPIKPQAETITGQ
jgi:hypothetical protein